MSWQTLVLVNAAYLAAVAWLRPYGRGPRAATAAALTGAVALWSWSLPSGPWLTGVLGLTCLLVGYQVAGLLFTRPSLRLERSLADADAALYRAFGLSLTAAPPAAAAHLLEGAYLLVYPMLPLGAAALALGGQGARTDAYWTAVLAAGFLCYGALPWLPSRTPRRIEPATEHRDSGLVRRVNLAVLARASTGYNTVPSGHAATSVAAALVVASTVPSPIVGGAFVALATVIAVATVAGRYHYAVDTLGGVAVGVACWLALA